MPGLARVGILSGKGHRGKHQVRTSLTAGPPWVPGDPRRLQPPAFAFFSLGSAWGQVKILARRLLSSFSYPFIKPKGKLRLREE